MHIYKYITHMIHNHIIVIFPRSGYRKCHSSVQRYYEVSYCMTAYVKEERKKNYSNFLSYSENERKTDF